MHHMRQHQPKVAKLIFLKEFWLVEKISKSLSCPKKIYDDGAFDKENEE